MEACHSPQQSSVTSYGAMALAIITLEAFPGMWINAFLVCVLCIAWVKKKILNSNEKILLLLGCSRFCYLCFSWVYCCLSTTYPNYLHVQPTFQLIIFFQSFFNCSNLWVSASLSVFYCIKIANFRNSFFIYLKLKTDRIVSWLLLTSLLSALAIGIIAYDIAVTQLSINRNSTGQGNFSKVRGKVDENFFQIYFIYGFGIITSFTAVISSALLLLFSLWRHKCKMQKNSMNSFSMDAHIKAMKSILSFFIMYSINFIFLILLPINSTKKENYVAFLSLLFLYAFPGVHSLILIFSNPKLEKTLIRILSCVKCKDCMR
ncbi:taste receptor type 2 member 9-like [Haemorhous mexicanus]|uniref:taste receptor type 2 member 9-like n=1 Tax=Haemorhous mexicanus TaxID=30427 RepID=UPI0028BD61ED|nr:taste receptor type 2 member 9-like [Haemorhous mexicanus]XP_059699001.1 taste receptor type 2 member 9-like [Haemorhous mexicanus]